MTDGNPAVMPLVGFVLCRADGRTYDRSLNWSNESPQVFRASRLCDIISLNFPDNERPTGVYLAIQTPAAGDGKAVERVSDIYSIAGADESVLDQIERVRQEVDAEMRAKAT